MLQFYKPNPKLTGSACSFSYNKSDKALWVNFVRQSGPPKASPFRGSGPDKKASSKLNPKEIAGLIRAIETNGEYGNFHSTEKGNTTFKFCPYVREGKFPFEGYSFSLNQSNKSNDTKKSFIMALDHAEGGLLKHFLQTVLNEYFIKCIEEAQFTSGATRDIKQTAEKVETRPTTGDNSQEIDLDAPW
tara:strand:- start:3857 stop:4420 length:564 start_codon:yes stop_codon:yes gene_type:complete